VLASIQITGLSPDYHMVNLNENPPPPGDPRGASEIVAFIESARDRGASDQFISQLLRSFGWPQRDIERAFFQVFERLTGTPMPTPPTSTSESAKDAFSYLLSFAMLGTWAYSVGEIAFVWVDRIAPDATQNTYYGNYSYQLAFSLARLIVAFPVYLLLMRGLNRELMRYREKHFSAVRKWLTYLTLLIVSLIAVGTLMAFMTSFLQGELTLRFVLKVAIVLLINGGILRYYLHWIQRSPARTRLSNGPRTGVLQ
jgi:hypothetical protein